jgi:hypothetical protein
MSNQMLTMANEALVERMDWTQGLEVTIWEAPNEPIRFYLACNNGYVTLLVSYRGRELQHGYTIGIKEDSRWQRFLLGSDYDLWRGQIEASLKIERARKEPKDWRDMEGLWVTDPADDVFKGLPDYFRQEILDHAN